MTLAEAQRAFAAAQDEVRAARQLLDSVPPNNGSGALHARQAFVEAQARARLARAAVGRARWREGG